MALLVETGQGVQGAESYASVAYITAYWAARSHNPLAAIWAAVTPTAKMEGAAREASAYIDATWGLCFRGIRRGLVQGLQWPRSDALDDAGYPLPDLPGELPAAVAELAARAVSATLAADIKAGAGMLKRVKAGSVEVEYGDGGKVGKTYTIVETTLAPLINRNSSWYFA